MFQTQLAMNHAAAADINNGVCKIGIKPGATVNFRVAGGKRLGIVKRAFVPENKEWPGVWLELDVDGELRAVQANACNVEKNVPAAA